MQFTDERFAAVVRDRFKPRVVAAPISVDGRDVLVAVRLLRESEIDAARVAAQRYLRDAAEGAKIEPEKFVDVDPTFFDRDYQRQVVWRAVVCVDDASSEPVLDASGKPVAFFPSMRHLREECDSQVVEDMFAAYVEHLRWMAPVRMAQSAEEVAALAEELKKGPKTTALLSAFDDDTLVRLCISLASHLHSTSATSSSSTG